MTAPKDDPLADYDPGEPMASPVPDVDDVPLPEEPPEFDDLPDDLPDNGLDGQPHDVDDAVLPPAGLSARLGQPSPDGAGDTPDALAVKVRTTLRQVLAGLHGHPASELLATLTQVKANSKVLGCLEESVRDTFTAVFEVLEFHYAGVEGATVDLTDLPVAEVYDSSVQAEVSALEALVVSGAGAANPASAFFALAETVQRRHTLSGLRRLQNAITDRRTAEELVELFHELEPPTTKRSLTVVSRTLTAAQYMEELQAERAGMPELRFSSGFRSLDLAFTAAGEPLGFLAPGEQALFGGRTGTGKSSVVNSLLTAFVQDVVNWGYEDCIVPLWHTEEESEVKIRAAGLDSGMRFHHLAKNVVVKNIGTSRRLFTTSLYDMVVNAVHRSQATGRPVADFCPRVGILDYLQALIERGEDKTKATEMTSELILRGFQAFNPDEMAKFGGVSFREYAGMPWPAGLENHRMAMVVMAQLVKQDENLMWFKPNRRDLPVSEFVLLDDNDNPLWEVREGDLRLLRKDAILGSSTVLNNATVAIMLHRSRPNNNPAQTGPDGRRHLIDTRARFLLDKTRTGSNWIYVPMRFDVQQDVKRGRAQYFDSRAEQAVAAGKFTPDVAYVESGDPILPVRPVRSPLAGIRY